MRVLHITEAAVGGIATYLNELLIPQLDRYQPDGDVALLLPSSEQQNICVQLHERACLYTYHRSGRDIASLMSLARMSLHAIRNFKPDVIHLHSSIAGLIVRLLPVRPPIVYAPHGWAFDIEASGAHKVAYRFVERLLAYRVKLIINVSEFERSSGLHAGLPAERMRVVRSGLSAKRLNKNKRRPRNGSIRLLFVGRFDQEKGLPWFLQVFKELPADRFNLCAIGGHVRDRELSIQADANLQVMDWQPPDTLDRYYDEADLVVVPSRWEAFGLVVVEAMRRGCPVLASDRGALPELMSGAKCGANLTLNDPAAWRDWLLALRHDQLAVWGGNAIEHYMNHFTNENMLAATHSVYKDVMHVGNT